ncbi:hypothetical protein [Pseudarthrobacter sp. LT1]|uniref:hypothetical protein n=1 Tax=Pseudarthrobacter sp. LT1 TaxID=3111450 RepID=UPI002D785CA4|nr:hypothetical protein [Pseudarthrobacter sp. LT1]WRT11977.1 hypothetical protein VIK36_11290 [Pseudarthrobacter sp. LT1]
MMAGTRNTRDGQVPKYFYATGGWGRETVIYAYTQEEWGLGGSLPSGGNYQARTFTGLAIVALIATIPAILAPLFILVSIYAIITSIPDLGDMGMGLIWFVMSVVCTVLFTGGWLLSIHALRGELKARKLRKGRGLPKPTHGVTDDQARRWFEEHPGTLEISRENFPLSTRPFPDEPEYLPSQEKRA